MSEQKRRVVIERVESILEHARTAFERGDGPFVRGLAIVDLADMLDEIREYRAIQEEPATLLDDIHKRVDSWFKRATTITRCEGESASITFELHGDSRGYTPKDEPIYEVTVEEKFFGDHLGGVIK